MAMLCDCGGYVVGALGCCESGHLAKNLIVLHDLSGSADLGASSLAPCHPCEECSAYLDDFLLDFFSSSQKIFHFFLG